ncbi:heme A synthase [Spirosoma sp. KCTC 42546]|uniref:COX15/CtaA family protein n=1 Tax=Spirosoma sp. KCTC 42546 TaxID=2520506 RepID=UPI00115B4227|nr:COX15/CtaA family protein [Spirosoma sp. KCTC 42546]QDK77302.1 heme A synthase [Spirosoma sp. KCTC 42546]
MTSSISLTNKQEQRFRSLVFLTIIVIYLVILAGGIVRSTGSGMGCPDWPKCFGRWVPPTEISQLPVNYQAIYGAKLKGEVEFNPLKTWIEYANRLVGVLSGFFVFATLIASLSYLRRDKVIFWGSLGAFLLIGANGWLGSQVVATELAPHMITIHMLLAIALVFALLFVLLRASAPKQPRILNAASQQRLLLVAIALTLGQIVLGTQVRDALDIVAKSFDYTNRESWIDQLDWRFYIHRSFSLVLLAFHLFVIYRLRKLNVVGRISDLIKALFAVVVIEIGTGVLMAYFGVPAVAQPIHLVLALVMIGLQFSIWFLVTPTLLVANQLSQKSRFVEV